MPAAERANYMSGDNIGTIRSTSRSRGIEIEAYPHIFGTFSCYPPHSRGQEKNFKVSEFKQNHAEMIEKQIQLERQMTEMVEFMRHHSNNPPEKPSKPPNPLHHSTGYCYNHFVCFLNTYIMLVDDC